MRLFRRKPKPKFIRLRFLLKSGSEFTLDRVNSFSCESNGPAVTRLDINQTCDGKGSTLLVASLDLKEIAAVVRLPD